MRIKTGWTVKGIIGIVFAPVGLLFVLLGILAVNSGTVFWRTPTDPKIFMIIFIGFGGIFLILGLAFLLAEIRRKVLLQRAYDSGNRVDAEIIGVTTLTNVRMNNRHPYVVECSYTDSSGTVHIYRSRYLYSDVTKLLKSSTVPVYIDRYNEKIGFVDIDAVLPEIQVHS